MKKPIYILLSRTNTLCGRMIRLATACRYNHISLALDPGRRDFYSFARRRMHNPLVAGFIHEDVHAGILGRNGDQPCALYVLEVEADTYAELEATIARFFAQYGVYRYNFLGVPLNWLGIDFERQHHYLCSQFVAYMLRSTGACTLPKPVSLMQPMDFIDIPELRLVYSGPLAAVDGDALRA